MYKPPKLLICDLDNTLYDWVGYFVPSFYAMVDAVICLTGCDREALLDDFRRVHQKYHDCEHPFSLLETDLVKHAFPEKTHKEIAKELDSAFYAFNSMRKKVLRTYPGILDALSIISENHIRLVAHTESNLYAVVDRLRRLDLARYFERIYCRQRPETNHPNRESVKDWFEDFPMERVVELSLHQRKPDPSVLLEICEDLNTERSETAYIGDSIARDVLMAKRSDVFAIWASYGTKHDPDKFRKLVRVTHRTKEDVKREEKLTEEGQSYKPDFVAESAFSDILKLFGLPSQNIHSSVA